MQAHCASLGCCILRWSPCEAVHLSLTALSSILWIMICLSLLKSTLKLLFFCWHDSLKVFLQQPFSPHPLLLWIVLFACNRITKHTFFDMHDRVPWYYPCYKQKVKQWYMYIYYCGGGVIPLILTTWQCFLERKFFVSFFVDSSLESILDCIGGSGVTASSIVGAVQF